MSSVEDPFDQVLNDTEEQIKRLKDYLKSHGNQNDAEIDGIFNDIKETIVDLERSIIVIQRSGKDTVERETRLNAVRSELDKLQIVRDSTNTANTANTFDPSETNQNVDDIEMDGGVANPFQEQMLREQDDQLDNIHKSMQTLHLHAQTMGQELEDQGQLLDDMNDKFDSVTTKLGLSRRKLEWVYEQNKEKYDNCCIGLLIVVLIVLLVLAFIA
ncbi:hypothetical protein KAFR_0K02500 [Kazachstania africana CBS 2517]|uniref:t-SNARE affecting a late Golgi compartment protein 1 n=1 Tax=Kazachstania africana (strain ATCC 22294 / BCRC 22015 / CBS 2517 / CECT 1963 / NBRC 1671 / NRRL Y-8276) TaxID=1071382 RepID=H2B1V6_KAZAF|nr:hypothetical protein KAFR_0K02500 [Kazachstania africana CBS 2517]CCF60606.1 hypothetical protein KAFR_0K02500 [Kazachstania africana CBS 2517]